MRPSTLAFATIAFAASFVATTCFTQAPAPPAPPLEDFLRRPEFTSMSLSPNGRLLAAIVVLRGHRNIAIVDLDKREVRPLTPYAEIDVLSF